MSAQQSIPVALTIAGSDSSAGAGAQADLKTFSAFGVYGLTAITCIVAETPGKVTTIGAVEASLVRDQIEVLFRGLPITAAKTGMLYSAEIVALVAQIFANRNRRGARIPLVVDPVMIATSGEPLLQPDAVATYQRELFPLATLVTPNLDEAQALLGERIRDLPAMRVAGPALVKKFGVPFLLKGGHLAGEVAVDLLCTGETVVELSAPFTRGVGTHGTGCTYAAAITAGLARGFDLEASVRSAKTFVTNAIARHFAWAHPDGAVHALNHSPAR